MADIVKRLRAIDNREDAWLAIEGAADEIERLREALVAHNDALRSACQVADRDGKDTNWTSLRGTIRMTLLPYHETVNVARAAFQSTAPARMGLADTDTGEGEGK